MGIRAERVIFSLAVQSAHSCTLSDGSTARRVSHGTSAVCISQEVVQLFRDKFHWGTKRDFVPSLKNDALNLDLAFQFM